MTGGRFGNAGTTETSIPEPRQACYIYDGFSTYLEPYLRCKTVSASHGTAGCAAEFALDEAYYDTDASSLHGKEVVVYVESETPAGSFSKIVFQGYITVDNGSLNASSSDKTVSARSCCAFLEKINVEDGQTEMSYPEIDPKTKKATTWTKRRILQDIFSTAPSGLRTTVALGSTHLISDSRDGYRDVTFHNSSHASAIEQCIADQGDVAFRERFNGITSPRVYLDFYRIGNPNGTAIPIQVGDAQEGLATCEEISNAVECADIVNRVKASGKSRASMSATTWEHVAGTELLIDGWSNTPITVDINGTPTTATPEAFVNADPERANPNSLSFIPECRDVMKKYYLPTCTWGKPFSKDGCIRSKSSPSATGESTLATRKGATLGPFAFTQTVSTAHDSGQPSIDQVGTLTGGLSYLPGAQFHFDQPVPYFTLEQPALRLLQKTTNSAGVETKTYTKAGVGVTFTLEFGSLTCDTGVSGEQIFPGIGDDGFCQTVPTQNVFYDQLTNNGQAPDGKSFELTDANGTARTFYCYYPDDNGNLTAATTKTIVRNDYPKLRATANGVLRERNKRNRSYRIKIPWLSLGFEIGYNVVILGQANYYPDTYMIVDCQFDFEENSTTITATNVRPQFKVQI